MRKLILLSLVMMSLAACATHGGMSTATASELAQGKRYFESGYYKSAMHQLLPLASDGNAEAQYAVGYMYYYGYGVAQDTDTGYFWIKRSANQHFEPAAHALEIMAKMPKK